MSAFDRFLRPPVLFTAGGITLGATALILMRLLGASLLMGLLIVVTIALVAVIVILIRQLRAARAAEEIEKTLTRQADRDIERSVPGKAAEMENMKAELLAAIEALKGSRLGKRRGQAVLSVLPWYMVIGPAGAGKSALVSHSGLHFPLLDERRNPRAVRGVGGTRSFVWWLAEEAVILDMAGRTLTTAAFEDTDDWFAFLGVLRRQRREKPLNGVLVTVSADQVAEPEAKVEAVARGVRERVQELVHHLGVVFPVYVVVTQCDRIAGFAEFFADLPAADRRQVWGATVPAERDRAEDAERAFDVEFGQLVAALSDRRMARLAELPVPAQRARALAFPLQLERLRPGLRLFVQVLFEPDAAEEETPLFRGFYLTSALQAGAAVDRVLQPIAASLGAAAAETAAPPQVAEGAFFVHVLLARVVFPAAALAAASSHAEAGRRRLRLAFFAGLAVAFAALTILFSALSCANGRLIDRARRASREAADQVRAGGQLMPNLLVLEELRRNAATLDSLQRRAPLYRRLGGYAGDVVRDPAVQLYFEK